MTQNSKGRDIFIANVVKAFKSSKEEEEATTVIAAVKSALGLRSTRQAERLIAKAARTICSKADAEILVGKVVNALEDTLIENLNQPEFSLKLYSLGKFMVRHKKGIYRKIPFTGETIKTRNKRKVKFTTLGRLRKSE